MSVGQKKELRNYLCLVYLNTRLNTNKQKVFPSSWHLLLSVSQTFVPSRSPCLHWVNNNPLYIQEPLFLLKHRDSREIT